MKNFKLLNAIDEFTDELSKEYKVNIIDERCNWNSWPIYRKLFYLLRKLS